MIVFLDANILGLISNVHESNDECQQCEKWFGNLKTRGVIFTTSDLCDYEVRKKLIFSSIEKKATASGVKILNSLRTNGLVAFLSVSNESLDLAANPWASIATDRKYAPEMESIDPDIILSAQYQLIRDEHPGHSVLMATTNLKHLSLFCDAAHWRDIKF